MSSAFLQAKMKDRAGLADLMTATLDKCAKDGVDPTPEQRNQLNGWKEQVTALDAEIAQLETFLIANDRFEKVVDRRADAEESQERREMSRREPAPAPAELRLSDAFTSSPAFTEYRGRGTSPRFEVDDIFGIEDRAVLGTAEVFPPKFRWDGLPGPSIVTPFLDLINRERVSTGSFDYVTWPQATGVAKVAEKAAKPEVAIAPVLATASLDTFAGWVQVTRQALEDVPRIRSQIETRLRQNLATVLEGVAIAALTANVSIPAAAGSGLTAIRTAQATVQGKGYRPNAIAINPADAAALDILVMQATTNGPTIPGSYWGLRVVPVPSLPLGVGYVADWSQAETWFDRGTTDIYLTDSHADSFIKNIFVILAEARAQFAVTDPAAAAKVTITGAAAADATAAK